MKLDKKEKSLINKNNLKKTILRDLPKMLQEDENFKREFIQIFTPFFAEKEKTEDRFNILLEEIRALRKESEERWREHSRILEEHSKKLELLTEELINLRKRQDIL